MAADIVEEYEGQTFSVEFVTGHPLRWSPKGKHWPKTTQCILRHNKLIIGFGEAIKHEKDKDDPKYARAYAAKKAFANTKIWREMRVKLWNKILKIED